MTGNSQRVSIILTPEQVSGLQRVQAAYGLPSIETTLQFVVQLVTNAQIKIEIQHTLGDQ